jgi:hypothetical protein
MALSHGQIAEIGPGRGGWGSTTQGYVSIKKIDGPLVWFSELKNLSMQVGSSSAWGAGAGSWSSGLANGTLTRNGRRPGTGVARTPAVRLMCSRVIVDSL